MKLVMKKTAFLEFAKAMGNDNFERIKADIIAHLKRLEQKEDGGGMRKSAEYFEEIEDGISHLEKSVSGEWIEKAGFGVGTVREWRGKKYKKIAQGKWVRVYDKADRGAKNAMTRLIHQAENINTPEEMMKFVLANKQRFVGADGKPLDIVDRLNAVIDGKEYKGDKEKIMIINDSSANDKNGVMQHEENNQKKTLFAAKGEKKDFFKVMLQEGLSDPDLKKIHDKEIENIVNHSPYTVTWNSIRDEERLQNAKDEIANYENEFKELKEYTNKMKAEEKKAYFKDNAYTIRKELVLLNATKVGLERLEQKIKESKKQEKYKKEKLTKTNAFGVDDIKSDKAVKTVDEMENVARQIAEKYKDNELKASSVWIDFMAYNIDGGPAGDLATDFMNKHGDVNFKTLAKKLSGKKLSEAEKRNIGFADEYATKEEEKARKKSLVKKSESSLLDYVQKSISELKNCCALG